MAANMVRIAVPKRFYAQALTQEWAGAASLKARVPAFSALQSTILQNGVTVSTTDDLAPTTNLTAFVRAGTRNETAATAGSAQLLSALAFYDTANRSALHIKRETESLGIATHTAYTRDTIVYGVSALRGDVFRALDNLSDAVTGPKFHPWELKEAAARVNLASAASLEDAVFRTAFHTGLGNRLHACAATIEGATTEQLQAYHKSLFTGNNIHIVGSGVGHEELVHAVTKNFADVAVSGSDPKPAKYFGGEAFLETAEKSTTVVLAHRVAGFEGSASVAVLRELLGGSHPAVAFGASHGALQTALGAASKASAQAVYHGASDAGLLAVVVKADAASLGDALKRSTDVFAKVLAGNFSAEEFSRAKNLAKFKVLDASRRQRDVVIANTGKTPEVVAAAIDALDAAAVKAVAAAAAKTARTQVVKGNLWSFYDL